MPDPHRRAFALGSGSTTQNDPLRSGASTATTGGKSHFSPADKLRKSILASGRIGAFIGGVCMVLGIMIGKLLFTTDHEAPLTPPPPPPPPPPTGPDVDTSRWLGKDATTNTAGSSVELIPNSCPDVTHLEKEFSDWYKDGTFAHMQRIDAFYYNAKWPHWERKSASGPGSDLGYATQASLKMLVDTIRKYKVKSMIDLPCGDNNWIFDAWETDSLELYIGLDIVQPLVELDKKRFAFHSNKVFRHWDGTICPLPKYRFIGNQEQEAPQAVDLIHSRDVLQHIGLQKGIEFLCNVFKSGAKLFVTTSFPEGKNEEIKNGDFFLNDLTSAPYDLPKGKNCVYSHPDIEKDLTCLYDLQEAWVQPWISKKCNNKGGGGTTDGG